jgi:hypothetical protein
MGPLNFTEEDKQKVVQFLNMVAANADFKLNTSEVIAYFKLLSFMQQVLIPKIDANILEVKKITENKDAAKQGE